MLFKTVIREKESRPDPMSSSDPIRKNNRPHTKRHAIKHQTNNNRTARKLWTTLNAIHNGARNDGPTDFYYTNRNCIVTADQAGPVSISPFSPLYAPSCHPTRNGGKIKSLKENAVASVSSNYPINQSTKKKSEQKKTGDHERNKKILEKRGDCNNNTIVMWFFIRLLV
jgi:hypothetical protein